MSKIKRIHKVIVTQKPKTKKLTLEGKAYYSLRQQLYLWQKEMETIKDQVWDLKSLLRDRAWEAAEKKMSLEYRHAFILYSDRATSIVREMRALIDRLDLFSLKNDK